MMGYTHLAAGACVGALAGKLVGSPMVGVAIGSMAALLPDIDHPGSLLGKRLKPVSYVVAAGVKHRGPTHTVWFCLAAAIAAMVGMTALIETGAQADSTIRIGIFLLATIFAFLALDAQIRNWLIKASATLAVGVLALLTFDAIIQCGPAKIGLFVFVGSLSHLVLDSLTQSGIHPFAMPKIITKPLSFLSNVLLNIMPRSIAKTFAAIGRLLTKLTYIRGPIRTGTTLIEVPLTLTLMVLTLVTIDII